MEISESKHADQRVKTQHNLYKHKDERLLPSTAEHVMELGHSLQHAGSQLLALCGLMKPKEVIAPGMCTSIVLTV